MKIAVNCIYYTPKGGGITEYIHNLVSQIEMLNTEHQFVYYVTKEAHEVFKRILLKNSRIKIFPYSENQKIRRSLFQNRYWENEEKNEKFEIFHSPFFHAPHFKSAKIVLTIHDLRFLKFPFSYRLLRLIYLKIVVKKSLDRAFHIISISNFTKQEIIKYYQVPLEKVSVIHEAVNKEEFTIEDLSKEKNINDQQIFSGKYLLAVGHLEPRKNYLRLIEAYLMLPNEIKSNYKLVIVGKKGHDFSKLMTEMSENDTIHYLNFVSRAELIWLYSNCKLHVFPSFYEGFGFSSLESGLFGKPTIGANQSSISEISGLGGVYFNPFNVEEIYHKLLLVLNDEKLYNELSKAALENVKLFSWKENAEKTLKVYSKI